VPRVAALLGTALGIIGSMATTAIGAHYTSAEHQQDRTEARDKERRDALIKTYAATIVALRGCESEALRFSTSQDPARPIVGVGTDDPVPDEIRAALELMGNPRANHAFSLVAGAYFVLRHAAPGSKRVDASSHFIESSEAFVDEARKDLGNPTIASVPLTDLLTGGR
jgi:hypothetical protein